MIGARPSAPLRDRVASIDVSRTVAVGDVGQRVLPSTNVVLGVQIRGRVRSGAELLDPIGVTGIQTRARHYDYIDQPTTVLVRFTPQGASCLGVPVSELGDRSVALEDLLGAAEVRVLYERVTEARSVSDATAIIEAMLLERAWEPDPLVERAITLLGANPPASVASVARTLAISERQLERRFLARVGSTPKRFASLRRFERALALAATAPSLSEAAFAAGYCDQSHFIREVRRFAGATPSELVPR